MKTTENAAMKQTTLRLLCVSAWLLSFGLATAQGTIQYLSTLDAGSSDLLPIASNSQYAAGFRTGTDPEGYVVEAVSMLMGEFSGGAIGFSASIYRRASIGGPGEFLVGLDGENPSAEGLYTFTTSGYSVLAPSTTYWLVLSAQSTLSEGFYTWSLADTDDYASAEGWMMGLGYQHSSDGLDWHVTRSNPFQYSIEATAVPEPTTLCLGVLGLVGLMLSKVRRRR